AFARFFDSGRGCWSARRWPTSPRRLPPADRTKVDAGPDRRTASRPRSHRMHTIARPDFGRHGPSGQNKPAERTRFRHELNSAPTVAKIGGPEIRNARIARRRRMRSAGQTTSGSPAFRLRLGPVHYLVSNPREARDQWPNATI